MPRGKPVPSWRKSRHDYLNAVSRGDDVTQCHGIVARGCCQFGWTDAVIDEETDEVKNLLTAEGLAVLKHWNSGKRTMPAKQPNEPLT